MFIKKENISIYYNMKTNKRVSFRYFATKKNYIDTQPPENNRIKKM